MRYHGGQNYYSQKICLTEGWAAVNIKIENMNEKKTADSLVAENYNLWH